jgi:hypothetical protein
MARDHLKLFLWLFPVPLLWIAFSTLAVFEDFYRPLANGAMNWRFRVRGPVEVPELKLIYANIDAKTIGAWGEQPFPRSNYAQFAANLFEHAGVKAVGLDVVLSPATFSDLIDRDRARAGDIRLAETIDRNPGFVLAGNYSRSPMPLLLPERAFDRTEQAVRPRLRALPYLGAEAMGLEATHPTDTYPEVPSWPLILPEHIQRGQVGLIDWNNERNADTAPRWIPLYADTSGPHMALDQLDAMLRFYALPLENYDDGTDLARSQQVLESGGVSRFEDTLMVLGPGGMPLGELPYFETEHRFYAWSLEMALRALDADRSSIQIKNNRLSAYRADGTRIIHAPLTDGQEIEIN